MKCGQQVLETVVPGRNLGVVDSASKTGRGFAFGWWACGSTQWACGF